MSQVIYESFASGADGLEIAMMTVVPEKEEIKGIFQLVHGMSEYKERYLPFMKMLAENGYLSVIHDHRGHGDSVKSSEDYGYTYGGGASAMLTDIDTVNEKIRKSYPNLPLALFGHSMGSLAVRAYASDHDDKMDVLFVCGSPSKNKLLGAGRLIARLETKFYGDRHVSTLINGIAFSQNNKAFPGEDPAAWLCSNPSPDAIYTPSEKTGFVFTDDGFLALFGLMEKAYDIKHWDCKNPMLPVLFISGADDPCMVNKKGFADAVNDMRRAGYRDVQGKLYPGLRHEILNESENEKVYADILRFVKRRFEGLKA